MRKEAWNNLRTELDTKENGSLDNLFVKAGVSKCGPTAPCTRDTGWITKLTEKVD